MGIRIYFHLFPEEAKELGMTHHGTMFGIPAYFKDPFVDEGEFIAAIAAIAVMPLLTLLFYPLGWALDLVAWMFPGEISVPITVDSQL